MAQTVRVTDTSLYSFDGLKSRCWSGAVTTLRIIEILNIKEAFMDFITSYNKYETWRLIDLNDLLWFNSDLIFEKLGVSERKVEEAYTILKEEKGRTCRDEVYTIMAKERGHAKYLPIS